MDTFFMNVLTVQDRDAIIVLIAHWIHLSSSTEPIYSGLLP